ncbi:MAG: hypothetical protein PVI08_09320, partial [Gammaproteobacteria bacterium]
MNLIIYSRRRGDARQIGLLRPGPVLAVILALTTVFGAGYLAAVGIGGGASDAKVQTLLARLESQQQEMADTERQAEENIDALTARIG